MWILIAALIALVVICAGSMLYSSVKISSKTTALGLRNIGELMTQEACFTNVQTIEKARNIFGIEVPGTKSSNVFSYDGVIKAGMDFSKIDVSVNEGTKTITVALPETQVFSVEIDNDSLKIYSETESIFTPIGVQNMNDAQSRMKEEAQATAISNGLLENARTNAETIIKGFLSGMYDLNVYTVEFVDQGE